METTLLDRGILGLYSEAISQPKRLHREAHGELDRAWTSLGSERQDKNLCNNSVNIL